MFSLFNYVPLSILIISLARGKLPRMLRLLVNTNNPRTIRKIPIAGLKYFKCFTIFLIIIVACKKNKLVTKKGIPRPREYASSELYAAPGAVAAKVSVLPKIGPTHGVQPAANAHPNTNDVM
jgi:hypothetical protein